MSPVRSFKKIYMRTALPAMRFGKIFTMNVYWYNF